ncbi:leucine-rich repeat domain-containing protein [Flagellimonas zhangzhouensis]|uniref:Leucine-rich repeat (LRR) protein n=1 Tax=Flagellimonas zhangzhouensis TaxID=1073328 RepID=A0A1H2W062_9FLAO|nr:leucine-rich repeat domain-containing protein [Allomuricauda zhangzhouensis]SDQ04792.1 Leucine-rich repeat (LRR) protein [Allomuricauda zhangzhouensis]SDW73479.1 Leucine-rich repeat (LRR) protein [Allomuricauda zhangzhouensis]
MMKKISILFALMLLSVYTMHAQEDPIDFKINSYSIIINHATSEAIEAINTAEKKNDINVVIGKVASQQDFDIVCENFPWIRKLEVSRHNEQIANIDAVSNLDSLTTLIFNALKSSEETPLDLGPLAKLTKLTEINFYATRVTNTEALSGHDQLKNASFYMSDVNSISFLETTPNIQKLSLYGFGHTFENYEPIAHLKDLKELNIYMNKQATDEALEVLKGLNKLEVVRMSNDKEVTSLDFLENNKNMQEVHANWCDSLTDFSALSKMKNLRVLEISDTAIENLDLLNGLTNLADLDISRTKVADISQLKNCSNLGAINISQTEIEDISPLFDCEQLWKVELSSKVPNKQIEKLKELRPKIRIKVRD